MTDDEYRDLIQESEDRINEALSRDLSALLARYQTNTTFIRIPGLITYTNAYTSIVEAAKAQMRAEASAIEARFYAELDETA